MPGTLQVGDGKPYPSIQAAINAAPANFAGQGIWRIEAYTKALGYAELLDSVSGKSNFSAADYLDIVAMVPHLGLSTNGISIDVGANPYGFKIYLGAWNRFHGFVVTSTNPYSPSSQYIVGGTQPGVRIYDNIIHDLFNTGYPFDTYGINQTGPGSKIFNNEVFNIGTGGGVGVGILVPPGTPGNEIEIDNNSVYGCTNNGFYGSSPSNTFLRNNVACSNAVDFFFSSAPSQFNYQISEDLTAGLYGGVGNLTLRLASTQFVTVAPFLPIDLHIKPGSACDRIGTPLAYFSTDNEGTPRVEWNTGADELLGTHTVTFITDGTPGSSITGANPQTIAHGGNSTPVTGAAPIGWHFVDWTIGGAFYSAANPLTVLNVTDDMTIQANFEIDTHTVTFQTDGTPGAAIAGDTPQVIDYGDDCTAVAAVDPLGWHFVDWTIGGVFYSAANPLTVLGVVANMTLQANFEIDTHTVTFQTDGTPGAAIAGDTPQVVDYGGNCTAVTAIAPAFFYFAGWTIGGLVISINETLVFPNVTHDTTIQANFLPGVYVCIDHKCEIVEPGIVGPNLSYMNFAGMLSGTVQTYRQNNTARKLGSRLGVT